MAASDNLPIIPIDHDNAKVVTNENGGNQSHLDERFDLLPPFALTLVAKILAHGVKYGEWNWRKIPSKDNLNHTLGHLFSATAGDTQDQLIEGVSPRVNHLAKAATRALFTLETAYLEDIENGR